MATDRPDPPPPDAHRPSHAPPPGRPRSGLIALVLVALVLLAALVAYLVLEGDPDESDDRAERRLAAVEVIGVDGSEPLTLWGLSTIVEHWLNAA